MADQSKEELQTLVPQEKGKSLLVPASSWLQLLPMNLWRQNENCISQTITQQRKKLASTFVYICTYLQLMKSVIHDITLQWNLSIKDTLNKGHLSNEVTVCSPNHKDLCTDLPLNRDTSLYRTASWVPMVSSIERSHCIQDSQLGPNGVLYREVPLYTGQPAGSQWCPL